MSERLEISNFCGIKELSLEINDFNIFIGPQATGKSVCAKLLYFFKSLPVTIINLINQNKNDSEIKEILTKRFLNFFSSSLQDGNEFSIRYKLNEYLYKIERRKSKIDILFSVDIKNTYSEIINSITEVHGYSMLFMAKIAPEIFENLSEYLAKKFGKRSDYLQLFIPSGRSFYAYANENVFSLMNYEFSYDPFIIEFGSVYSNIKKYYSLNNTKKENNPDVLLSRLYESILCGEYLRKNDEDYLIHNDGRIVRVSDASSGQQESLPIILLFKVLLKDLLFKKGLTIYLEEPEAHLFPMAQKKLVELISYVFNNKKLPVQFIVTTHSPYILTAINNILTASQLSEKIDLGKQKKIHRILPKKLYFDPKKLSAYAFSKEGVKSIIDEETGLILADEIDSVSEQLAIDFEKMLELDDNE